MGNESEKSVLAFRFSASGVKKWNEAKRKRDLIRFKLNHDDTRFHFYFEKERKN